MNKFYIKIKCKNENPKEDGEYFTDQGCINWKADRWYMFAPLWWLKKVDILDLIKKFKSYSIGRVKKDDLLNKFLIEKGIITKI